MVTYKNNLKTLGGILNHVSQELSLKPKPMASVDLNKQNDYVPRAIDPYDENLTPLSSHREVFNYLMNLDLLDGSGLIDEPALRFIAKSYPVKHLVDCYYHLGYLEEKKNSLFPNALSMYRHLLNQETNPICKNCFINRKVANHVKKNGWHSLQIYDRYVEDDNHDCKDLSLNMNPDAFMHSLKNLWGWINR